MRAFVAFLKKEGMESVRNGKLLFLALLFLLFGIMNPAVAKLTPWLLEAMSDSLAESGMTVTAVEVDAMTSWTQFFKNIPMALIAFVLAYSGSFSGEYTSGTLVLVLTKGLQRYKVVLCKAFWMLGLWTAGYFLCFGVTYAYNDFYWDNAVAQQLIPAVLFWYLWGVLTVSLTVFFSSFSTSYVGVLLGTGGVVLLFTLLAMIPKLKPYVPTHLMDSASLLVGAESAEKYLTAVLITAVLSVAAIIASIPIMNRREI